MIGDVLPENTWSQLCRPGHDVPAEMASPNAHRKVDQAGHDQQPGGEKMEAARPSVLIERLDRAAGREGSSGRLKKRRGRCPIGARIARAERELEDAGIRSLPALPQ